MNTSTQTRTDTVVKTAKDTLALVTKLSLMTSDTKSIWLVTISVYNSFERNRLKVILGRSRYQLFVERDCMYRFVNWHKRRLLDLDSIWLLAISKGERKFHETGSC